MGALAGLLFALGVLLAWAGLGSPRRRPALRGSQGPAGGAPGRRPRRPVSVRAREELVAAGLGTGPAAAAAGCLALALAASLLTYGISRSANIAAGFGVLAVWASAGAVRGRARRRRAARRQLWPDAVDNLASGIRAGMSLPEALGALGERGPEVLREPFRRFAAGYRATGRFDECLDLLKDDLADPTADRVLEALRLARHVGGNDVGRLLRTLSAFLREDARTRAELESRQSWTVSAARLGAAAPWVVLLVLSLRPEAVAAYDRPAGAVVLAAGGLACAVAYRLMLALGRLPDEARVLAGPAPGPRCEHPGAAAAAAARGRR